MGGGRHQSQAGLALKFVLTPNWGGERLGTGFASYLKRIFFSLFR